MEYFFVVYYSKVGEYGFGFGNFLVKQINCQHFNAKKVTKEKKKNTDTITEEVVITGFQKLSKEEFENWHHNDVVTLTFDPEPATE